MANARSRTSLSLIAEAPDMGVSKGRRIPRADVSIAVMGKVEGRELLAVASALEHLGMAQRAHRVVVAGTPMLRHGQAGELIVFRVAFIASRAIDEVHEVVGVASRDRGQELR